MSAHNILFCCATEKGLFVIQKVYEKFPNIIGLISSFPDIKCKGDFNNKIEEFAKKKEIPFIAAKKINKNFKKYIFKYKIKNVFAIGWKYIIPFEINKYLDNSIIIFHDSLLPELRGFSPTPTAIMIGKKETGVTAFFAAKLFDSGDIIFQKRVSINKNNYVNDVISKLKKAYAELVLKIIELIDRDRKIPSIKQKQKKITYSIWRDEFDLQIDWNKSAKEIYDFIRAVSYPYLGAYTYYEGKKFIIKKSQLVPDIKLVIRESGKFWSILSGQPVIVCGKGMLKISEWEDTDGKQKPFKKLRSRFYKRSIDEEIQNTI